MIFWRSLKKIKPKTEGFLWVLFKGQKVAICWHDKICGFGIRNMRTGAWVPAHDDEITHWAPVEPPRAPHETKKWIFDKGMWRCPYCGEAGEPNYLYCPSCGQVTEVDNTPWASY